MLSRRIDQLESVISTLQKDVTSVKAVQTSELDGVTNRSIAAAIPIQASDSFVDLYDIEDATRRKPTQLRLPRGAILSVNSWSDVLRECCKFALLNNPALPVPFADRANKTVSLISNAKPPVGISFVTEKYNGQTVYIRTNYDANNCVANARHVLTNVSMAPNEPTAAVTIG